MVIPMLELERQAAMAASVLNGALLKLRAAYNGDANTDCILKATEAAMLWRIISEHGTPGMETLCRNLSVMK